MLHNGWNIINITETGSTNTDLCRMAREGAANKTVLIAERQTGGKGRRGRSFLSPEGGLYMSLLLRELPYDGDAAIITSVAAVAFRRALQSFCKEQIGIKWVNDLLINGKKLAGILTEGVVEQNCIKGVVVGVGVNLGAVPAEVADIACSLGGGADAQHVAEAMLDAMDEILSLSLERVMEEYRTYSVALGHKVLIIGANGEREAQAITTDDRARLICRTESGEILTLNSGEISIKL